MSDEERVPLLSNRQEQPAEPQDDSISLNSFKQKFNLKQWLKEEWPILRIVIAMFLWALAKYGAIGPTVAFIRIFVCAEYFWKNPELSTPSFSSLGSSFKSPPNQCALPAIEAKMSSINLIVNLLSAAGAACSVLLFTPLLSKGRKRVLQIGLLGTALVSLPFIMLPIDPIDPFEKDVKQILNPEQLILVYMSLMVLASLLGPDDLPLLGYRVLINDRSNAQKRTRNLNWLTIGFLSGLSIAPGLISGLCQFLPSLSASSIDHRLYQIGSEIIEHRPHGPLDGHAGGSPPVPIPIESSSETNIMPFILAISLSIVAMLWTQFMIPESAGLRDTEDKDLNQEEATPDRKASSGVFSVLSILAPKSDPSDPSSPRDWRLLQMAVVAQANTAGSSGLESLIYFVGYALQWSPTQVNIFISWIGTSRTLVLFVVVPALLIYSTRITKKPQELSNLSKKELDRVSKNPMEVETEIEREEELEEHLENSNARVSQIYRDQRELLRLQEQVEEDSKLRHMLSMWRAKVDLKLLRASIFFDVFGWLITAMGAQSLSSAAILLGGVALSLGAGAPAATYSVGVAIATDMHHRGFEVGGTAQEAGDSFMGALTLLDTLSKLWAPLLSISIYKASLGSAFDGAPFLFSASLYLVAFLVSLRIKSDGRKMH